MKSLALVSRTLLLTVVGMVLVAAYLLFQPQLERYRQAKQKNAELADAIKREETRLQELQVKKERFQNDPAFVEQVAHGIGMVRPNEVLFKFHPDAPTSSGTDAY